jgi:esterase/lipase superfamily enzyme
MSLLRGRSTQIKAERLMQWLKETAWIPFRISIYAIPLFSVIILVSYFLYPAFFDHMYTATLENSSQYSSIKKESNHAINHESGYVVVPVFYGTDRKVITPASLERYGGDRGSLVFGVCEVTIPNDHKMGELEAPKWWHFELTANPTEHVVLKSVDEYSSDKFFLAMKNKVLEDSQKEAFVFVHGYNVTFENAARRTAQMAYDLGFKGAPIFYSWPSQGNYTSYPVDENNVEWTALHLKEFLSKIASKAGAQKIHLIAHSMGNRALTNALRSLAEKYRKPMFNQVILAAPDIDSDIFKRDILPSLTKVSDRVTLYASSNDKALKMSKEFHRYNRAGESGNRIVIAKGLDTVDATQVDTGFIGHSYFGDNRSIISDIYLLLTQELPPEKRNLKKEIVGSESYWLLKP